MIASHDATGVEAASPQGTADAEPVNAGATAPKHNYGTFTSSQNTLTRARSSFFNRVQVGQKQASVFGHFFLAAAAAADKAGLRVMFGAFEELSRLNREQSANWHPLTPLFDPKYAHLSDENAFCIFGVNEKDEIVACPSGSIV